MSHSAFSNGTEPALQSISLLRQVSEKLLVCNFEITLKQDFGLKLDQKISTCINTNENIYYAIPTTVLFFFAVFC